MTKEIFCRYFFFLRGRVWVGWVGTVSLQCCQFLLYKEVNQLYVYVYSLTLESPSHCPIPPIRSSQSNELSSPCNTSVIYFIFVKTTLSIYLILFSTVTRSLFFKFMLLLLSQNYVYLNCFSRFHIYVLICNICVFKYMYVLIGIWTTWINSVIKAQHFIHIRFMLFIVYSLCLKNNVNRNCPGLCSFFSLFYSAVKKRSTKNKH